MKRRDFLRCAGMGLAGIALMPDHLFAAQVGIPNTPAPKGGLHLTFRPYRLDLIHTFTVSKSSRTFTPDVLTFIEYDGVTGYGEASMPPYLGETQESVCNFLSKVDLSQFSDPFRMEEILDYVDGIAPGNPSAKAAIDIALHDLVGKLLGQPWYRIWGLSPEKTPYTSFTIGIDTQEVVRQKVAEASPYKILKVKVGVPHDKATIETIRSMTDRPICVDANEGWKDKSQALEMIEWLARQNCLFIEQPLPKEMVEETAWLRERSPLPIIADEAIQGPEDIAHIYGIYDGINIKLMKSTGLYKAYQMAITAKTLGMKVMIGCMTETSCAISAAAQLSPLADWADLDGNLLISNDCYDGVKVIDGRITLNDKPGIGVSPR